MLLRVFVKIVDLVLRVLASTHNLQLLRILSNLRSVSIRMCYGRRVCIAGVECVVFGSGKRSVMYHHGGGYVVGSAYHSVTIAHAMLRVLPDDFQVVSVNYAKSPEYPYPEPQRQVKKVAAELLPDIVGGPSAGAALALVAARACDPSLLFLHSPWIKHVTDKDESMPKESKDDYVTLAGATWASKLHLQQPADPVPPVDVSPLSHPVDDDVKNFGGLPPVILCYSAVETLGEQCKEFHDRLLNVGVKVTSYVSDWLPHAFLAFPFLRQYNEKLWKEMSETMITHLQQTSQDKKTVS